eukprot:CAMPEP_0184696464 /NCGR_PEP_ID=MMETSP0313-20130426/3746_1 /TAXON_ID=2792 /ORGANISM="Porphyridium aerugineum, Strain SAG 1380-2" /LENGTH=380 /DNA_ID=CAMNT_0027155093 /DNA_START=238 /DNA_END=1380 /DNA_ORIENTATION=+
MDPPSSPKVSASSIDALLHNEKHKPFRGKTGIVLVNIGTPESTAENDVREYLRDFLGDKRVVDINPFVKFVLLNMVILPFRPKKSAEAYKRIWNDARGSPLLYHTEDLKKKLEFLLGDKFMIQIGMQFKQPNLIQAFEKFRQSGVDRIIVVPMFPQYASSTTGSAAALVYDQASKLYSTPYITMVPSFFDHPAYISAYANIIRKQVGDQCAKYDHLLLSFHGVPENHCTRTDETGLYCMQSPNCCATITQSNRNCYRAQCFATARRMAAELNIPPGKYSVAFQSRLDAAGPKWITPYTDKSIANLAKQGIKRLAVVVPSFTADCLETLEEIGIEGKEEFLENGGEEYKLIECLNSDDIWAQGLVQIIQDACPQLQIVAGK